MKIEIKKEISEVFFCDIDVGSIFREGGAENIYMKINESRCEDNAYDFSNEKCDYFSPNAKVQPVRAAELIIQV